ncbi:putative aryl-alcohol dehydrogenase AAD14 [Fusarium euwallaceae]|uniref:Putative aryl-alcohol dehydrogenase AAD14 n=1 Tax=Fusarium euwallaceae TaxID=1147111 RepID=A0A430L9P0_9HYPO|nr:putative aryl-alcohol dehydrogenase AAD14 [Fusarium euwallaceae]
MAALEISRYRILSSTAGVRVSPLQLGTMSLGGAWSEAMPSANREDSFKLLDAYTAAGGNFIDTANNYQNENSERFLGEWMQERKNRDMLVIATKYTLAYKLYEQGPGIGVNHSGNHRRSLHMSVRDSLKKLQTEWIDILYLHMWDWSTSIPEIMDSLHNLVLQGKVLYLGASDTPAWVVSAANEYAMTRGKTPFSIYQGKWSILERDFERDIIPMARHYGMALAPWGVLGGGRLQSKEAIQERRKAGEHIRNQTGDGEEQTWIEAAVSEVLSEVAKQHGDHVTVTAVALAYVFHKAGRVFPIVGGRKVEHLKDNLCGLELSLTLEQVQRLEGVVPFNVGFPLNFIGQDSNVTGKTTPFIDTAAEISWETGPKPLAEP